jgi:hypothetical protein
MKPITPEQQLHLKATGVVITYKSDIRLSREASLQSSANSGLDEGMCFDPFFGDWVCVLRSPNRTKHLNGLPVRQHQTASVPTATLQRDIEE